MPKFQFLRQICSLVSLIVSDSDLKTVSVHIYVHSQRIVHGCRLVLLLPWIHVLWRWMSLWLSGCHSVLIWFCRISLATKTWSKKQEDEVDLDVDAETEVVGVEVPVAAPARTRRRSGACTPSYLHLLVFLT